MKDFKRVILASASPRRQELLKRIFDDFEVIPSDAEEIITGTKPSEIVMELATIKAMSVAEEISDGLIIGSDTVVVMDDRILGKPHSVEEAYEMLKSLSGRSHQVYTGVCLIEKNKDKTDIKSFYESTDVIFSPMNDAEIKAYIESGDPFDKAGGYGIQGIAGKYISGIKGDYNNVVGLPVARLYKELKG